MLHLCGHNLYWFQSRIWQLWRVYVFIRSTLSMGKLPFPHPLINMQSSCGSSNLLPIQWCSSDLHITQTWLDNSAPGKVISLSQSVNGRIYQGKYILGSAALWSWSWHQPFCWCMEKNQGPWLSLFELYFCHLQLQRFIQKVDMLAFLLQWSVILSLASSHSAHYFFIEWQEWIWP